MPYKNYCASVVVTSDTCSNDPTKDASGQYVVDQLESLNFSAVTKHIVEDDKELIIQTLKSILNNDSNNALIITVGGTGLCPRDVTPEASCAIYDRQCRGISTALLMTSLRYSPHAALSRLTAGISGECLIVNFPGSLKACKNCFACLKGFLEHAIDQVRANIEAIKKTHLLDDIPFIKVKSESSSISLTPDMEQQPDSSSLLTASECIARLDISRQKSSRDDSSGVSLMDTIIDAESGGEIGQLESHITESPYPLIEYDDALRIMNNVTVDYRAKEVNIDLNNCKSALGATLVDDVTAKAPFPPYNVSTMDGYVCHIPEFCQKFSSNMGHYSATIVANIREFENMQQDPSEKDNIFCYQVNTGQRVPESDFIIIPFEDTKGISANRVSLWSITLSNKYLRAKGSDLDESYIMNAGTVIGPVQLALLLQMGHDQVKAFQRPTIGILSTGDELIRSRMDDTCESAKIVDTNGPLLISFFSSKGFQVVDCGIAKDTRIDTLSKLETSLKACNILVITGGASMGTKDCVKDAIKEIGGTIHFGRVNMKPGKPVSFASLVTNNETKFIFSLPGNSVSAYITSLVLVVPFIERISRKTLPNIAHIGDPVTVMVEEVSVSNESYEFDGRYEFIRARFVDGQPNKVEVMNPQHSSCMRSLEGCNCLILIDPTMKGQKLTKGESYRGLALKK